MWMKKYSWLFCLAMLACSPKSQTSVVLNSQEMEQTQDSSRVVALHKNYLMVEFYKGVSQTQAQQVLTKLNCKYQLQEDLHEDDSHQNKAVTSRVGHKYLLTFLDIKKQALFMKQAQTNPTVFRIWDEHNHKSYTYKHNNALVVVFKDHETEANCHYLLEQWNCTYYSGIDAAKGKKYLQATGPQFIVNFPDKSQAQAFIDQHQKVPEVHKIYQPDWGILKD